MAAPTTALAPMEGITGPWLRGRFASVGGLDMVCTEFVRVSRATLPTKLLRRSVVKPAGAQLSVQVMGNEVEKMAEAAGLLSAAGADVIDLNVGCPMPRVVKKGVGAAMLKDPRLLFRVVSAMRARVPGTLSAKVRLGWDESGGALERARVLADAGVDLLVVHARRRSDLYRGVADWRVIAELARALPIPVIGNGDLWYARTAHRMRREAGVAGVMIGRPALRNPWIFEQLAALEAGETPRRPAGEDLVTWLGELEDAFAGETRGAAGPIGPLKEQLRFLLRAVKGGDGLTRELLRQQDTRSMMELATRRLGALTAEELDLDAEGSLGLETVPRLDR